MVEGKRHLGAIFGTEICKREYVDDWFSKRLE